MLEWANNHGAINWSRAENHIRLQIWKIMKSLQFRWWLEWWAKNQLMSNFQLIDSFLDFKFKKEEKVSLMASYGSLCVKMFVQWFFLTWNQKGKFLLSILILTVHKDGIERNEKCVFNSLEKLAKILVQCSLHSFAFFHTIWIQICWFLSIKINFPP